MGDRTSLLVRVALAVIIVLALAARPSLLPFAAAGALVVLLVSLWLSGRRKAFAAVGAVAAVVLVFAVLTGGDDKVPKVEITGEEVVPGVYVGHLVLTGKRDLRVAERLDIARKPRPDEPRPDVRAALSYSGWKGSRLRDGTRRYRRSVMKRVNAPGLFPQERTNYFVPKLGPPSRLSSKAPAEAIPEELPIALGFSVAVTSESRVVLDAPSGAIAEMVPDAEQTSGPGTSRRATLAIPKSGDPIEFAVRSTPFRTQPLATAADLFASPVFGVLLMLAMTVFVKRVRDFLWGWLPGSR